MCSCYLWTLVTLELQDLSFKLSLDTLTQKNLDYGYTRDFSCELSLDNVAQLNLVTFLTGCDSCHNNYGRGHQATVIQGLFLSSMWRSSNNCCILCFVFGEPMGLLFSMVIHILLDYICNVINLEQYI